MATRRIIDLKASNIEDLQAGNSLLGSTAPNQLQTIGVPTNGTVRPFGLDTNPIDIYPNDIVQLDIRNAVDQYLETNYRISNYIKDGDIITLDPERDLSELGYISGKYNITYRFFRNMLGGGDSHKLQIQEISSDGLEVRVVPMLSSTVSNVNFLAFFESSFFTLPKPQVLPNLFLHKDANISSRVFDYVQDKFTYPDTPYSILFKLTAPISSDVNIGDQVWINQQLSDDVQDSIVIIPPKIRRGTRSIAGANWDVATKETTSISTQYKDWDDLLSTNQQTSQNIVNSLLSSSNIEGIPLNIDYSKFENFIHFGSAAERLYNFKFKIDLLESYDSRIASLGTDLSGLPSSSVTSSIYFQSNVLDAQNKRSALIGSMDGYEKYLLYGSSSYVSNSFGEFYPTTWPKSNSTKPYALYSVSSSAVSDWFDGIIVSASLFDQNNNNSLNKLVPLHILEDDTNSGYSLFVNMVGHYFDLIFAYVKQMSFNTDRKQDLLEGFSKDLVFHISKNLGLDFENGSNLEELWSYVLGTDISGSLASTYAVSNEDKTKEIWKRIINNLPYLLKTKGTERSLRALINCFGIPQTILRIREFGGAEPEFESKTDLVYERFNYATRISKPAYLETAWAPLNNGLFPMSVELRVKMYPNQNTKGPYTIMSVGNGSGWSIIAKHSESYQYAEFRLYESGSLLGNYSSSLVSTSLFDGSWHHIALTRASASDNPSKAQRYNLTIKKTNYLKVVSTQTASLLIEEQSYNKSFSETPISPSSSKILYIPDSDLENAFSGSVQELRYWSVALQDSILDNHALAPTSFQGNLAGTFTGSTSSFDDLQVRFCLGSDNRKVDRILTASEASQHPNQSINTFSTYLGPKDIYYFDFTDATYEPIVELHSLEWPDLGGNRSIGNKIRVDDTILAGDNTLYRNISVERALTDNYPIDSSRLGVYLSPTNEINQDIAEQFGGLSIDDFIGDPSQLGSNNYPDLEQLRFNYLKKYTRRGNTQNYIRLLRHYDSALFKLIKKFVPYRANTQVGLVVEPHLLHRSRVPGTTTSLEELHYSSSIIIPDVTMIPGGAVQDGDGDPFRDNSGYVDEATIDLELDGMIRPSGEQQPIGEYFREADELLMSPTFDEIVYDYVAIDDSYDLQVATFDEIVYDYVVIDHELNVLPTFDEVIYDYVVIGDSHDLQVVTLGGAANEYNQGGEDNLPSDSGSLDGLVDLGISGYGRDIRVDGSQYVFISYETSGSGSTRSEPYLITSSRYDYHEALAPTIMGSRRSEIALVTNDVFDRNIYGNKAFTKGASYYSGGLDNTAQTIFTSSIALYQNYWTKDYGLRLEPTYTGSTLIAGSPYLTASYWKLETANQSGLQFYQAVAGQWTASAKIPAFFYKEGEIDTYDYLYEVTINTFSEAEGTAPGKTLTLFYGDFDNNLTQSIFLSQSSTPTNTSLFSFITKATGPWLGFRINTNVTSDPLTCKISSLSVKCLNYRSDTQDFHLNDSYGMRNARYDGCKLTSTDWNVNSPDTTDGGPVVTITIGNGSVLQSEPNNLGNFSIL